MTELFAAPHRVHSIRREKKLLEALSKRKLTAIQIAKEIGLSPHDQKVYNHLWKLKNNGVIRKDGNLWQLNLSH